MNIQGFVFGLKYLTREEIENKRILEVGSFNVNGSLRSLIETYKPAEYIGADIAAGPGVDVICNVTKLKEKFGEKSFDMVVATELLEHVKDWRRATHNIKAVCKPNGVILVTTRSPGFEYHGYPYDFWRYELQDMQWIFQDCRIENLEPDPAKGVFIKCVKPVDLRETVLVTYALYSMVTATKIVKLEERNLYSWYFRARVFKQRFKEFLHKMIEKILGS